MKLTIILLCLLPLTAHAQPWRPHPLPQPTLPQPDHPSPPPIDRSLDTCITSSGLTCAETEQQQRAAFDQRLRNLNFQFDVDRWLFQLLTTGD